MPQSRRPDKVTVQLRYQMGDVVMAVDLIWIYFQLSMQKKRVGEEKHKGKQQNQHKHASERKIKASSSLSSP